MGCNIKKNELLMMWGVVLRWTVFSLGLNPTIFVVTGESLMSSFLFFLAWKLIVAIRVVYFHCPVALTRPQVGDVVAIHGILVGHRKRPQLWHRFLKRKSIRIASYQRGFHGNIIYKWWFELPHVWLPEGSCWMELHFFFEFELL